MVSSKVLRVLLVVVVVALALTFATHWVAFRLDNAPELTGRLLPMLPIYWPWQIIPWWVWLQSQAPQVFAEAMLIFLLSFAVPLFGLLHGAKKNPVPAFGIDQWGGYQDLKAAGLLAGEGTVIGLFKHGLYDHLIVNSASGHSLHLGPSRSGKSAALAVPTALSWKESLVVHDIKGELFERTSGFRNTFSHTLTFQPTDPSSAAFNPLAEVRSGMNSIRDAQNIALSLANPDGSKARFDVWDTTAMELITGLIVHLVTAPNEEKHLGRVRNLLHEFERADLLTQAHHPETLRVVQSLFQEPEKFRANVIASARQYLTLWADPMIVHNTSHSDFRLGDLMCAAAPVSLYLQPPPSDTDRLRPLIRLLLNQLFRALLENLEQDGEGRKKQRRLLLLLDEFPALGRFEVMETALSEAAGYGINAMLIAQSFSQIAKAYGLHNSLIDNCSLVTAYASADTLTQERLSKMAGSAVEYRTGFNRPGSVFSARHHGRSESEAVRHILPPGEVRRLSEHEMLLFVNQQKPFRVRKLFYFQHEFFQDRVLPAIDQRQGIDRPSTASPPPTQNTPVTVAASATAVSSAQAVHDLPAKQPPRSSTDDPFPSTTTPSEEYFL